MIAGHRFSSRYESSRRFRCRPGDAIIKGVCAGIADFVSLDRTVVRLVALLLLWFFTVPTALLYLLLAWLGETR